MLTFLVQIDYIKFNSIYSNYFCVITQNLYLFVKNILTFHFSQPELYDFMYPFNGAGRILSKISSNSAVFFIHHL